MGMKRHPTKYPGVFYNEIREVGGRGTERMYLVVFKRDGVAHEVRVGSDKRAAMTAAKANTLRTDYIQGRRQTRAEKAVTASQPENLTLADYVTGVYLPEIQARKKPSSIAREESLARLWIIPAMGKRAMKDIGLIDLEKLKKTMHTAGKAARTMVYALAVLRQVFHHAELKSPLPKGKMGSQDKRLKADNRRLRYLTPQEADLLLAELKRRSEALYEISLTSLHMGLRAGELFALAWADVDLDRGVLTLLDPKGVDSRTVYMTEPVRQMFVTKLHGAPSALVWPGRGGKRIVQISDSFNRAVNALGLNDDIADPRQRVVFHSLRHSCASFLVNNGVPIYTVQHVLGHKDVATTTRYAKVSPATLRDAAKVLEKAVAKGKDEGAALRVVR